MYLFTQTILSAAVLALPLPAAQLDATNPGPAVVDVEVETPTVGVETSDLDAAILLLSGYHGIPDAEAFETALSDPTETLFALATDDSLSPIHRDRALGALAYWPSEQVQALYISLIEGADTPEMVRHRVIGHFAYSFGEVALPYVAPYLTDDDVQFRLTAIDAISHVDTPAAQSLLAEAAQSETHHIVLQRLEAAQQVR
jgi:hypothetical protein